MQRFEIHLITDRKRSHYDLSRVVTEALLGGVDCIQVREKGGPARALYETSLSLLPHIKEAGAALTINDRVDVALATGADGVHLAAKSLPPKAARELLGEAHLLGCSVHSLAEAQEAINTGADYVTFGHVYPTSSKPGSPPRGVRELADIVESVEAPVLAIGGIDEFNVREVLSTGCAGIAVISTIGEARNPRLAAQRLREAVDGSPDRPRRMLRKGIRLQVSAKEVKPADEERDRTEAQTSRAAVSPRINLIPETQNLKPTKKGAT